MPHARSAPQGSRGRCRAPGFAGCALAPPPRRGRREGSSTEKIRKEITMKTAVKALRIIAGAMLIAIILFVFAAAPGLLSASSSTITVSTAAGTGR